MNILIIILVVSSILCLYLRWYNSTLTPDQKIASAQRLADRQIEINYGIINSELICPHCQVKGKIHTKSIKLKKGISGAKATEAVLTAGLSLIATGLSRKEDNAQAHCENCNSTLIF